MRITIDLTPAVSAALAQMILDTTDGDAPPMTLERAAEIVLISGLVEKGLLKEFLDAYN